MAPAFIDDKVPVIRSNQKEKLRKRRKQERLNRQKARRRA